MEPTTPSPGPVDAGGTSLPPLRIAGLNATNISQEPVSASRQPETVMPLGMRQIYHTHHHANGKFYVGGPYA